MTSKTIPTHREEDVIEAIYRSPHRDQGVSVSELCKALGLAKPTVSIMVKKLQEKNLVQREPYKRVFLTKDGAEKAKAILDRHETIKSVLMRSGTPEDIAEADACQMEHFLHPETLQALIDSVFCPTERETHNRK
ncbi:metal-dependent transcriptional regulator [Coprothermobacter platensis]|uniref:metal-dependent transcriptional regulator n=1 Tax=Coprothermobacter platensis TaxID=108819 RepID=UPI000377DA47|nr:metal-dependent transcriptional regulator [Coprothermobacter platensis]